MKIRNEKHKKNPKVISAGLQRMDPLELRAKKHEKYAYKHTYKHNIPHN